ncbi:MAG: hypothetical protein ACFFCW_04690 [Candidatus Hodarchaeota archaeon]
MVIEGFPVGFLEKYLGPFADLLGINEILISYILEAIFLLILFALYNLTRGETISVKKI